jgi:predicted house-cleaning noncanonical NTP pyrophosphatase (MazG superfamily)
MNIYGMDNQQIKDKFIRGNKISYTAMLENALIESIEERMGFCDNCEQIADMLDTLENFMREFGYIDEKVSEVYEKLYKENIKK